MEDHKHVLLVTFPSQGNINPSLQFAKRLTKHGVQVTFMTSLSATRRLSEPPSTNPLLEFASFSDGYDDGWSNAHFSTYMSALTTHGSKAVEDAIASTRRYARVVYTPFVPFAGKVAQRLRIPVTLLWIEPAIVYGIYFYYFNNSLDLGREEIELPGLPQMEKNDLPSFFHDSNPNNSDSEIPILAENFQILDREINPTVLVNTFDALESEALNALNRYKLMAIGPLIPSAFLEIDPSDNSFGADLIQKSVDYIQFLDSKEKQSVIYVAFGSYSELSKQQMEELGQALIKTGRPFLWVIRGSEKREKLDEILSCREELEKQGKIVPWCTQLEVLSHPSIGCFVSHCGWNSTLEGLVWGIPMVMMPQWTDQVTNAKLVEDLWRYGVRVGGGGGVAAAEEIARCLEAVMGGGEEMRRRGKIWGDLGKEAVKEGGSSSLNLNVFVDQLVGGNA